MNKKEDISKLFESFSTKKIMVIGDVMLDAYQWGRVDRISPEAPVPVVTCLKRENRLGGAANVALNLLALNATPFLCGIIGNDDTGTLFLKALQEYHLDNSGIMIINNRPTTSKIRIIGGNQQLLRVDEEVDSPLKGQQEKLFIDHAIKCIRNNNFDAIIFQDYDKGVLTENSIKAISDEANKLGIPTLVDPKKRNFAQYKNVSLFKPNWKEFSEGLKINIPKDDFNQIFETGKQFLEVHQINLLMITLSEKGVFICNQEKYFHIPAHTRDITDVSGAGDTVISVASLCLSLGLEPMIIAAIANLAGGLVCEKVGVVPINKNQLFEELLKNTEDIFLK